MIDTIIIKTIRACNLRCDYCYYINSDTENYGRRLEIELVRTLYSRLVDYGIGVDGRRVGLIWHGGEPLLAGKSYLDQVLQLQEDYLPSGSVNNMLQTNGSLIDLDWVNLFVRHDVKVGLSLDGPSHVHDVHRRTATHKGSYDEAVSGLRLLQEAGRSPGAIAVVQSHADGAEVLQHFADLGIEYCDFLIPITNHALQRGIVGRQTSIDLDGVRDYLASAFERWVQLDGQINVRLFQMLIRNAFGIAHSYFNAAGCNLGCAVVLETDGSFCLDTDFSQIDRFGIDKYYRIPKSLTDQHFSFASLDSELNKLLVEWKLQKLPSDCEPCPVRSICRGSHPASRFDDLDRSFDHRSAYCDALKPLSLDVLRYLIELELPQFLFDRELRSRLLPDRNAPLAPAGPTT